MNHSDETGTQLILASASPRRQELLAALPLCFEVIPSHVPEDPLPGESPEVYALRLAVDKAREIAYRRPAKWVLGADTIVVLNGDPDRILGKPESIKDAARMLSELSGRPHWVMTGMALLRRDGATDSEEILNWIEKSRVHFRELSLNEIDHYAASGEPMDKAGGYAIQGGAGKFVDRFEGSYSNIVGLPMESLEIRLREIGLIG